MPRLLVIVVIIVTAASPAWAQGAARSELFVTIRRELRVARETLSVPAKSAELLRRPGIASDAALRKFVTGYASLLAYHRAGAQRALEDSYRLAPSPHTAAALATNTFEIGLPDELLSWAERGLAVAGPSDRAIEVELRLWRAQALAWLVRTDEQGAELARALVLARELGDAGTLALALRGHAGYLDFLGEKVEAIAALDDAIRLSESQGDRAAVGYHLLQLTAPYYPVHPFADKLTLMERGLALALAVHDRHLEGRMLALRGLAYLTLDRYGLALSELTAADAVFRFTGGLRSRATTAGNLSVVFNNLGEYDRAVDQAGLAITLYRRISSRPGVRQTLDELGRNALLQGQTAVAVARHSQVVSVTREMGDMRYLAGALVRLGLAYLAQHKLEPAERAIREALAVGAKHLDSYTDRDYASAFVAYGDLQRLNGRPADADRAYHEALVRAAPIAGTAAHVIRAHHGLALLASRAGQHQTALNHYRQALVQIETVRDGAVLAELRLTYFADKTALYADAIAALVDAHREHPDTSNLDEALVLAERAKARTLFEVIQAPASRDEPVSVERIASSLGPADLLVEYVAGANRSFALTLKHDRTIAVVDLPARKVLEDQVRAVRAVVTERPSKSSDMDTAYRVGARAAEIVLGPVRRQFAGTRRLIFVADGPLAYAPFEAFTIADRTFLGERFEVVRAQSGAVLSALRERRAAAAPATAFVGFGDPLTRASAPSRDTELVRALARDGFLFAPLPGSREEVEAAAGVFGPSSRIYTGAAFTAAAAIRELQRPNRVAHFATHAILDDRVPGRSGIVVSTAQGEASATILLARDLESLKVATNLVVLSACQTGLGRIIDGEGVLGLTWALTRAGAASLMVTLWNVSDAASASMMVAFYRAMAGGRSKSAALHSARLAMIQSRNPSLRHPYYWAGYILLGDPD